MARQKNLARLVRDLEIEGSLVDIQYVSTLQSEDVDCLGLCHIDEHRIEILDIESIPYESQLSTLLHEAIEFIVHKNELDIEHRDISAIERGLYQVLRHNPEFCRAFTLYRQERK